METASELVRYGTAGMEPGTGTNILYNQVGGSGFGSRGAKMTHQNRKKVKYFHVLKSWMFSLRAGSFSCSLDVLYGALRLSKCNCDFFSIFGHQNPGSGLDYGSLVSLKFWIRNRINKSRSETLVLCYPSTLRNADEYYTV